MIIRQDKGYETNSMYPDTNWYPDEPENYIVDETTEEGQALAQRIMEAYPFFDLVVNGENELVDIKEWDEIEYQIDKIKITTDAFVKVEVESNVTALIDGEQYVLEDNELEYGNENLGTHQIVLQKEDKRDTIINIEVVESES